MESATILGTILFAYLLGAIPVGLIVGRVFGVPDIRKQGSGNIGATNVWRVIGARAAVWVYIFDIGKGVIAVMVARQVDQSLLDRDIFLVLSAVAVVLGNILPVFLRFKGGKGVNTSLGAVLTLMPWATLFCVAVFLIVVLLTRMISLGSMVAACSLFLALVVEKYALERPVATVYIVLTVALAVVILVSHRQNIRRIVSGTENKFSLSSKTGKAGSHV